MRCLVVDSRRRRPPRRRRCRVGRARGRVPPRRRDARRARRGLGQGADARRREGEDGPRASWRASTRSGSPHSGSPGKTAPTPGELARPPQRRRRPPTSTGSRSILSVYPSAARHPADGRRPRRLRSLRRGAGQALPTVQRFIVGNEPNLNRFWMPQFIETGRRRRGAGVRGSARADVRRAQGGVAVDHRHRGRCAPRAGTDSVMRGRTRRRRSSATSALPTGAADGRGRSWTRSRFHPYLDNSSLPPSFTHPRSTTISLADYGKLVALLGKAFDGTAQTGSALPGRLRRVRRPVADPGAQGDGSTPAASPQSDPPGRRGAARASTTRRRSRSPPASPPSPACSSSTSATSRTSIAGSPGSSTRTTRRRRACPVVQRAIRRSSGPPARRTARRRHPGLRGALGRAPLTVDAVRLDCARADLRVRLHEVRVAFRGARPRRPSTRPAPTAAPRRSRGSSPSSPRKARGSAAELPRRPRSRRRLLRRLLRLPPLEKPLRFL